MAVKAPDLTYLRQPFSSQRSLALPSAIVCHCMLLGASGPPAGERNNVVADVAAAALLRELAGDALAEQLRERATRILRRIETAQSREPGEDDE